MELFTLLVDGKDVDTGQYEYFPYADKAIQDFKATYRQVLAIKKGKGTPEEWGEYIHARYCVESDGVNKKAIDAAYKASLEFRFFPVSVRRKILGDIHKNLLARKEELLKLFVIEGHPMKLAEWEFSGMERAYRAESLDYYKDELWTEVGRMDSSEFKDSFETMYLARKPDGVVCISPPKNAPCSNSLTAGFALLGGNSIIVKPPYNSPLSTIFLWKEIVWKAAKDNGAPDGTVNIIIGNSKRIMDEWIESPFVNDIIYFGPSDKGLEIGNRVFLSGKKPILELSGNDIMLIWKDADLERAVQALLDAYLGSTQICMVPKAALVHAEVFERFRDMFVKEVRFIKVGLPSDPETCLTPVLKIKEFYQFLEDATSKGAEILYGGDRIDHFGNVDSKGSFINPTVVSIQDNDNFWDIKCLREENFFPLLPLVKVGGHTDNEVFSKMTAAINSNPYGLRASVWVRSSSFTRRFVRYIHNSGLLRINSRHVDFSSFLSTHGGTGRTGGPYGELNYIWQKTTHLQGISLMREK